MEITGRVEDGLGEGRKYLSIDGYRRRIAEALGFEPFPGTLNVALDGGEPEKNRVLHGKRPRLVGRFSDGGKEYGGASLYPCTISGQECAAIIPELGSRCEGVLEIISPENLRASLGLRSGTRIKIEI